MLPALRRSLVCVAATLMLGACATSENATGCRSDVVVGEVPVWARTGFGEGAQVPHVLGAEGRIVAVLFGESLVASEGPAPVNKVLLVPREPLTGVTPLAIDAQWEGSGAVVHRERVDGPGPGTLDMPAPGCWRMTLAWGDESDTIDLQYVAPAKE